MENQKIKWQAPEYKHTDKKSDWFWAVWIIALSISIAAIIYNNFLFAILIIVGSFTLVMFAMREPQIINFEVNTKGIIIEKTFYPYRHLKSFWINDDNEEDKKLFIQSDKMLMPLIHIPLAEEYTEEIQEILSKNLDEEEIEEPFSHKLMEYLGF